MKSENTTCKSRAAVLLCTAFFMLIPIFESNGETFVFKEKKGTKQHTISTVNEQVLLNGELLYDTLILNRMTSEVKSINTDNDRINTQFDAVFTLAEERLTPENAASTASVSTFSWKEDYKSVFSRNDKGKITIARDIVMPTVRDVPIFPDKDIVVGETWSAPGVEAHDLGPTFGIKELFTIPFVADYKYIGEREWRGKKYKAISITYTAEKNTSDYFESDPKGTMLNEPKNVYRPTRVLVKSDQIMLWDSDLGQPVNASEHFSLIFKMSDGNIFQFMGTAEAEIIESTEMDKTKLSAEIDKSLKEAGINDATVKIVDDGVSISIENIQFHADSAFLQESEKKKLDKIGEILKKYSDRDILVGGHTALAGGTAESRMQLSNERAGAVAAYLIKNSVRPRERIMVRGFGSNKPIADNVSEEGKRKNRRVEITILEN
ncbi:MAG: OmpA family protein [Termitinemataceae bacterium]|nr:MAG: OmpA family protein [Termitinemataceae bacterium]